MINEIKQKTSLLPTSKYEEDSYLSISSALQSDNRVPEDKIENDPFPLLMIEYHLAFIKKVHIKIVKDILYVVASLGGISSSIHKLISLICNKHSEINFIAQLIKRYFF